MNPFDAASPFDSRYYLIDREFFDEVSPYASEAAQVRYLAKVEAALAATLADIGVCPREAAREIAEACDDVKPEEVYEEEQRIQHNIRALANCIRKRLSPSSRAYVHLFATSNDVTDTARAMCLKDLTRHVVLPGLADLVRGLIEMARGHADAPQMGRTHGKHAVPITFGFAIALYVSRLGQRMERIAEGAENLRGKFAGAVGGYNTLSLFRPADPAEIERILMEKVGLKPPEVSSQIVQPEYVTDYVYALCSAWGVVANLADDFRHLLRSEIHEVRARIESDLESKVVGSSTMPHKVNPKDFENVKSSWKAYMPRIVTLLMDQISEHQRDLTNSMSGRFVIEFVAAFAYAVRRARLALAAAVPDVGRMREILDAGKDAVVAEPLYILLSMAGHPDAHEKARVLSKESVVTGRPLSQVIQEDPSLQEYLERLSPENRAILKDPAKYVGATPQRTKAICEHWEGRLPALLDRALVRQVS
ncbi:MAG: lyase family protein [Planctomycetota bacterium]|jgi:adenylosuccinate lyase